MLSRYSVTDEQREAFYNGELIISIQNIAYTTGWRYSKKKDVIEYFTSDKFWRNSVNSNLDMLLEHRRNHLDDIIYSTKIEWHLFHATQY